MYGARVSRLVLEFECRPTTERAPVDHYKLGDTEVGRAVVKTADGELSLTITAWPGQPLRLMAHPVDATTARVADYRPSKSSQVLVRGVGRML